MKKEIANVILFSKLVLENIFIWLFIIGFLALIIFAWYSMILQIIESPLEYQKMFLVMMAIAICIIVLFHYISKWLGELYEWAKDTSSK